MAPCDVLGRCAQQWFIHDNTYTPQPHPPIPRIRYTWYRWVGLGGFGIGCQWLAELVSRVLLYVIWMGGAGGVGDGLPMVSGDISHLSIRYYLSIISAGV